MAVENKIGISTITLARSAKEEKTIINSLKSLITFGLPVVIVDGGSAPSFTEQLRLTPNIILTKKPEGGLFSQVKKSLYEAVRLGHPYILYTEANKLDFFQTKLGGFLEQANSIINLNSNIGVVVASRTPQSFSTFPPFQRLEEKMTNQLLYYFLGVEQDVDYTFGPRIISASLINSLDRVSNDLGWGWLSYILLASRRAGKEIHPVTLDLPCPQEEREETEKDKLYRLRQFKEHVNALHQALSIKF